jgi:hypothetical protein
MKIKEICKENKKRIIRFSIILILTLLVSIFLIPDRKILIDNVPIIEKNNQSYIDFNTLKENITQQIQKSIDSGNIIEIFWKTMYSGGGLDKLCYEIGNNPSNMIVTLNDSLGRSYEIVSSKCFDATKPLPDFNYNIMFTIPYSPGGLTNKSECINGTISEVSHPCKVNNKIYDCYSCLTNRSIENAQTETFYFPEIKRYFETGWFHKTIKFIFIFILTGIVCWNITRVWVLIRDGIPSSNSKKDKSNKSAKG